MLQNVFVPFPRSVPRHNPVSELYGQLLLPHGLVFALTCTVNCGTLYIDRFVPFKVMSNQLNLPKVDSNIKDNQWKQDGPVLNLESHIKESEYLCK